MIDLSPHRSAPRMAINKEAAKFDGGSGTSISPF
jgi:hypothetical protein